MGTSPVPSIFRPGFRVEVPGSVIGRPAGRYRRIEAEASGKVRATAGESQGALARRE